MAEVESPAEPEGGALIRATTGGTKAWLEGRSRYPMSVTLVLTDRCNLRCPHCIMAPRGGGADFLSYENSDSILADLAHVGVMGVLLTGGEPSLHPRLIDFVQLAVSHRFYVKLKTNATLLSVEEVDRLVGGGLAWVDISMYHDQEARHDQFVGKPGSQKRALLTARRFRDRGAHVRLVASAMSWNEEALPVIWKLCQDEGFRFSAGTQIVCRNDGCPDPIDLSAGDEAIIRILRDPLMNERGLRNGKLPRALDSILCGAGRTAAVIGPDGGVRLCQRLPHVIGNAFERPFSEIWTQSPERQRFVSLRWADLPSCSTCELSGYCERCPASAYFEHGDELGISTSDCLMARIRREAASKL